MSKVRRTPIALTLAAAALSFAVRAEVRVQDIARLQGQRTNKLMGFGLVVGLSGTGDGGKYANTTRALMALHRKYEQPVVEANELRANNNVALVTVEVVIPEFGAREGQALDVIVAAVGPAKSLKGGQLLTTPLQESTLTIPDVLALAGGRIELPDVSAATRGFIRGGATLEQDFFYTFVEDGFVTFVLDESHAGYPFAQMVARAINHEIAGPASARGSGDGRGFVPAPGEGAVAIGPKQVRVRIPEAELAQPAGFITRALQTPLFIMPQQPARVVINRASKQVSCTGAVTLSPTVLQIPGLGTLTVGTPTTSAPSESEAPPAGVEFQALLDAMAKIKLTPDRIIETVEHLHRTGTLHAQLVYTE
ncbi:MAG: flagellar basal body P-ring protein FlgI [Phycisphaerae bacterium]